jgi:hypothetical protein
VLAVCWSTLEDVENLSLFPEILSVNTTFSKTRRNVRSLLELGWTTIGVTFQLFNVSYLLSRDGYLNLLLDTCSLLFWDTYILEEFKTDRYTEIYFPLDNLKSHPTVPTIELIDFYLHLKLLPESLVALSTPTACATIFEARMLWTSMVERFELLCKTGQYVSSNLYEGVTACITWDPFP